jgi:hypothetical protein
MTDFVFPIAVFTLLLVWFGFFLVRSLCAGRTNASGRRRQRAAPGENSAGSDIDGAANFSQDGRDGAPCGSTDGASSNSCDAGSASGGGGGDSGGGSSSCD